MHNEVNNAPDWKVIKVAYLSGTLTYKQIAEKYGIKETTLHSRVSREKWTQNKQIVATKTQQKRDEKIAEKLSKIPEGSVADNVEVMQYLTSVMRGQTREHYVDKDGNEREIHVKVADRTTAAEKLARMLGADKAIDAERLKLDKERLEAERKALEDARGLAFDKASDPFIQALSVYGAALTLSDSDTPEGISHESDEAEV